MQNRWNGSDQEKENRFAPRPHEHFFNGKDLTSMHSFVPMVQRYLITAIVLVCGLTVRAADTTYYFYRPYDYGSMSMFTPWNVVLNGSYDVLQLDGRERRLSKLPYGTGLRNVWDTSLVHPGATRSQISWCIASLGRSWVEM